LVGVLLKSGEPLPMAKIAFPNFAGALPRERLSQIFDTAPRKPITWINAPAGFGRTVLGASYITQTNTPSIWYCLDERETNTAVFFYFMGLAARIAAPKVKRQLPLCPPESLMSDPALTLRYFGSLYDSLRPPFLIVFDDYQRVPQDPPFHGSVTGVSHVGAYL
jgi:LuxR family maltose regulon positive regulatory protein